jgi:hypothetical protein
MLAVSNEPPLWQNKHRKDTFRQDLGYAVNALNDIM